MIPEAEKEQNESSDIAQTETPENTQDESEKNVSSNNGTSSQN